MGSRALVPIAYVDVRRVPACFLGIGTATLGVKQQQQRQDLANLVHNRKLMCSLEISALSFI